ncbi:MAG: hypothetical protein ABI686_12460 [Acidobacteriota bacterium]
MNMEEAVTNDKNTETPDYSDAALAKKAIVPGVINGVINGAIEWFKFNSFEQVQITGDSISSSGLAVFGEALQVSLILSLAATIVAYLTFKTGKPKPSFFPNVLLLTFKHIFLVFGIGTSFAILWQRIFGTIMVSPLTATLMVTVIAGLAAWFITWMTMRELVKD